MTCFEKSSKVKLLFSLKYLTVLFNNSACSTFDISNSFGICFVTKFLDNDSNAFVL